MDSAPPSVSPENRYQVGERIGRGGAGHVFRAWDSQLGRWVALKRLFSPPSGTDTSHVQAWKEAQTLASLQHPNIVTVYDFGTDAEGPFVVMELLQGEDLETVIVRGVLALDQLITLVQQSLNGLVAAHHAGLIHRDIKPGNLMLIPMPNGSFQAKLLDFGLARLMEAPQIQTVDATGQLLGSVYCMAPEQFNREPLDARTDLYAIGCLYYFICAGHYPFQGETITDVMISHLKGHSTPLEQVRPDLPAAVCTWIHRLLQVIPDDRPASAAEALSEFNQIFHPVPAPTARINTMTTPKVSLKVPAAKSSAGTYVVWTLIAISVLLAAVLAGQLYHKKSVEDLNQSALAVTDPILPSGSSDPLPVAEKVTPPPPVAEPIVPAVETPAATAAPASAETGDPIPVTDMSKLRSLIGSETTVKGTVLRTGENKKGDIRFMDFSSGKDALTLVFFARTPDSPFTKAALDSYIGKTVVIKGKISEYKDLPQIVVNSFDQITVVP